MPAPQDTPGASLDRVIATIDNWFGRNFGQVHAPVPPEDIEDCIEAGMERCRACGGYCTAGDYAESGQPGDLRRELASLRRALAAVSRLGEGLDRFAGLDDYQADLAGIRARLAEITTAAARLSSG